MSEPFIAEIRIFAGNYAPRGWALCNGQLLNIAQNTALFSLVGTTYGGDGRTNFALPNLQGRAPMHPGRGPGLTTRRLGERGGTVAVTLSDSQLPSHTHAAQASNDEAIETLPGRGSVLARPTDLKTYAPPTSGEQLHMAADSLANTGGGQAHSNMQPYLAINFIIALVGLFPSPP